jgi:nanoRNase/pAp phosphatase (c-di-AMP/oligoRNAs hydrolase)
LNGVQYNLGDILKELKVGGGHTKAGGISSNSTIEESLYKIKQVVEYMIKHI